MPDDGPPLSPEAARSALEALSKDRSFMDDAYGANQMKRHHAAERWAHLTRLANAKPTVSAADQAEVLKARDELKALKSDPDFRQRAASFDTETVRIANQELNAVLQKAYPKPRLTEAQVQQADEAAYRLERLKFDSRLGELRAAYADKLHLFHADAVQAVTEELRLANPVAEGGGANDGITIDHRGNMTIWPA